MPSIRALVLSCSLKKSLAPSSSELLGSQVLEALQGAGSSAGVEVTGDVVRVADLDGSAASVCKMVLERLDGAHHVTASVLQALNDVGFSIAANAGTYWVGEAMQPVDYNDLDATPEKTAGTTAMLASCTLHLARLLQDHPSPPRA
jgi:hypothetical protein